LCLLWLDLLLVWCGAGMIKSITGSYKITYHPNGMDQPPVEVNFTPPFKRISMVAGIQEAIRTKHNEPSFTIPPLSDPKTQQFLDAVCNRLGVDCPAPRTTSRLLDKVCVWFFAFARHLSFGCCMSLC
jgi:lysyl-tRNA synthetase class 2